MRGRSRAVSAKPRRRKPGARKRSSGTEAARPRSSAAANRESEIARVTHELAEARQEQTAAADVLRIISSSPGDLEPVFKAMLVSATRLCEASYGTMWLQESDGQMRVAAKHGILPEPFDEQWRVGRLFRPTPSVPTARVFATGKLVQVTDLSEYRSYFDRDPLTVASVEIAGIRTLICVPMLKGDAVVGALNVYRREVRPFTDKQIELVQNFAAQAVIAIENARLLNELRESLEQQTATSEVLKTISSSPGELEPVFQAMLTNATRICEAKFGILYRCEEDGLRTVAMHDAPQPFIEARRSNPIIRPNPYTTLGRATTTKQPVQIANILEELDPLDNRAAQLPKLANARTVLAVPMLKENELIGAFLIYRTEVRPFTEKQIALVQSFAAQAVIAIENARLLNELRQRTTDLTESLEQQTATANVLGVISASPGELQPVYHAMLQNAVRLCDARFGNIYRCDGDTLNLVASHNTPPALFEARRSSSLRPDPQTPTGRIVRTRALVHIADLAAEQAYAERKPAVIEAVELGGIRTLLLVPMLRDDNLVGVLTIYRQEVRPFTDKQIALMQNFAAQAVIAIENTRLLNELRQRTTDLSESLEQQTATSDVLRVISSSPGELEPVFQAMLENALRICEAQSGNLFGFDGEAFYLRADLGTPPAFADFARQPRIWGKDTVLGQITRTKQAALVVDALADSTSANQDPGRIMAVTVCGSRTILAVPMLRENELIGAFVIFRQEVRPFTDKQIALVKNFAAQAVIAIENARLLSDLNKLNQQLEQRVTDQVGEIERMGRLRRFLPPQVADLIIASGSEKQLESHRREITSLFCDLRGFTGFSESSDPEDVMALLRDYHAAIGEIIVKYSGTLERFAGDGVMVIFNDPVPVENPALQAVLMALDMRTAIGAMIEKWRLLGHDLGFGIGIAHGFATLGTIGFEGRFDYAAIGTVSNVASRLCDEAKPGQILISPRVMLAVDKTITVELVGEFNLKGIRRPMAAYNVLSPSISKPN